MLTESVKISPKWCRSSNLVSQCRFYPHHRCITCGYWCSSGANLVLLNKVISKLSENNYLLWTVKRLHKFATLTGHKALNFTSNLENSLAHSSVATVRR